MATTPTPGDGSAGSAMRRKVPRAPEPPITTTPEGEDETDFNGEPDPMAGGVSR